MQLIKKKLTEIKPYKRNPRINDNAVEAVAESIRQCEYNIPDDSVIVNGKYIVTRDGDIFRYSEKHHRIEPQRKRKNTNGYLRGVMFGKDVYIHRIVAMCFVDNPNGYKEINHKDGDKTNNSVENLEWCTRAENCQHMFSTGLRDYSELSDIGKLPKMKRRVFSAEQVRKIRELCDDGLTDREIAARMNASRGSIYQIRKGVTYREVQ